MLLIGHRGTCAVPAVRENTFAAFDLALENGCHGIEFDVRVTNCGRAVICHDEQIGSVLVGKTNFDQLSGLPDFEQVVQRYGKRAFLDIDIKVRGLGSEVILALNRHPPEQGYVVSSFLPEVIRDFGTRTPQVPLGFICNDLNGLEQWPDLPVEYLIAHKSLVSEHLVNAVHEQKQSLVVWTVNDKKAMLRFAGWGVDGIISDETALLTQLFGRAVG